MADSVSAEADPQPANVHNAAAPAAAADPAAKAKKEEAALNADEDDLDELDDMLDQFSSTHVSASGPGRPPASTDPSAPPPAAGDPAPDDGAEFSAQLQQEMAALLGDIDESPEMRKQLNELMGELTAGAERALEEEDDAKKGSVDSASVKDGSSAKAPSAEAGAASAEPEAPFTDTIRRTLERMAASGKQASAAAAQKDGAGGSEEELLATLLKDMAAGAGEGSDEEFSKMLMGMMEQLTNKDILYEPMKELDTKFPDWMKEHEGKEKEEDMVRYREQQVLVREIVGRFERKGYSDDDPKDREFIVERMQKMQAAGSPPSDLVGDMKGASEALGELGPECSQQ